MKAPPAPEAPGARRLVLSSTVFVTGAGVLVVEIVGARVLAPSYGSGLYSWSALISVTLAALALGYGAGGWLADRRPGVPLLASFILLGGVFVLLVPWVAGAVLGWTAPLSLRAGVLTSAALLFFPPLFCLGAVSPAVLRVSRPVEKELGSVSGLLFAVSTAGSLGAAVLTGFVLIPNVGLRAILTATGAVLALLSAALFAHERARGRAAAALLLASLALLNRSEPARADGLRVVHRAPSFYGLVRVVDVGDLRVLTVDGIGQNYVSTRTGEGRDSGYVALLGSLPALSGRAGGRALLIGLGAGEIVARLSAAGVTVDVVEIDERIAEAAREYFGLTLPPERVHLADGRAFLKRTPDRFDTILLDAFVSEDPPGHLLTREAFQDARARLAPRGLVAVNYTGLARGDDVAAVMATMRSVFPHVRVFTDPSTEGVVTTALFGSMAPVDLDLARLPEEQRFQLAGFFENELPPREGLVLTDDYCPLASLRRGVSQQWRRSMVEFFGGSSAFWGDF